MKRRDFLKVVGASGVTVAAAGCAPNGNGGVEKLLPYVVPSEDIVPGVPTYYTSTCRECPAGCGILVETHSGRVTKLEGNPENPISRGNLCARGQAAPQGLYHPDRIRGPHVREGVQTLDMPWASAERRLVDSIRAARPGSIVFLTSDYTGTMARLADAFVASVGGRRVIYDPFADQPRDLSFADADFLISFGADFLETWGSPVDYAGQFGEFRARRASNGSAEQRRNKFVWVGPHRPMTGLNADQWIAPKPGTEALVAAVLAGQMDAASAAQQTGVDAAVLQQLAAEFNAARHPVALGPGNAITGRNAASLRQAVDALNRGTRSAQVPATRFADVVQLVEQMKAGQIDVLLIDAPDPAYTLPGELGFAEAMKKVPMRVSFSSFPDETSMLATLQLPDHHFLEKWDDYIPRPGVFELVQPAMRPVFNTKQVGDVLLSLAQQLGGGTAAPALGAGTYYDYLRQSWQGLASGEAWRTAVRKGGIFAAPATAAAAAPAGGMAAAAAAPVAAAAAPIAAVPAGAPAQPLAFEGEGQYHLVVYPSYRFFDGRTANRPWLLELPDPVTKVPWDSWVEMHPRTARELGLQQGDVVEVKSAHGALETFVYVYPGVRPDTLAIQTGLGHTAFGRWSEGRGVNPNVLLGAVDASGAPSSYGVKVSVKKVGNRENRTLVFSSAPGGLFEQGVRVQHDRELSQAVSLAALIDADGRGPGIIPGQDTHTQPLKAAGGFIPAPTTTDPAAYPPPGTRYGQYIEGNTRWAMAIDLSRCIGCAACVIACNAENNIPVVGPKEMKKGRELHWLRIERYFGVGRHAEEALQDDATDDVRFLPMLCQHCGNAPCEPVCPVYAAYHTPDGLAGQVYNRCVGTRYCANNCPYKVRVFNWFTYEYAAPLDWQLNPDVLTREKGVMEKCSFCVQRIHEAERDAALQGRHVRDGEIAPACVQTCPTDVFVFGNIQDPESRVAQVARSNRSYRALEETNSQPAIVYLKKVTLAEPKRGGHAADIELGEPSASNGNADAVHMAEVGAQSAPGGAGTH
jgi:molybdopterin-containing oxidoreductase family iron-sulfur binding subunit